MEMSIVQQLLNGSAEIDRMKKEIDSVVKMVVGLLRDWDIMQWKSNIIPDTNHRCGRVFQSSKCEWIIKMNEHSKFDVECIILSQADHASDRTTCAYDSRRNFFSLEYVERVHQCLNVFVISMALDFPNLTERMKPLLEANPQK